MPAVGERAERLDGLLRKSQRGWRTGLPPGPRFRSADANEREGLCLDWLIGPAEGPATLRRDAVRSPQERPTPRSWNWSMGRDASPGMELEQPERTASFVSHARPLKTKMYDLALFRLHPREKPF